MSVEMPASKIKQYLAGVLKFSGWYRYQYHKGIRNNALILMYHRVLLETAQSPVPVQAGMYVTPDSLRLQFTYLKEKYNVISLQELVQRLDSGQSIAGYCAITFDDGWQDNYQYAFPVIRELELPVTIFLTTGFIGSKRWFWPEELAWCISSVDTINKSTLIPELLSSILEDIGSGDGDIAERTDRIIEIVKQWEPLAREKLLAECSSYRLANCKKGGGRLLLNWSEVREMSDSGLVSFGSHTVSHELLDQVHGKELQFQLLNSMAHLKREISDPVPLLAYPNGNHANEVLEALPKCGYTAAVTTQRGFADKTTALSLLPRIAIHDDVSHTLDLFQWRLFVR